MKLLPLALLPVALAAACSSPRSYSLSAARRTGGPTVRFEPSLRPIPEVPYPTDLFTRPDLASPTGRRLDLPFVARTRREAQELDRQQRRDGFGTFAPITVSFDAPIDVRALLRAHEGADARDDAVYLLNVDRTCTRFGEQVALDIGAGVYPVVRDAPDLAAFPSLAAAGALRRGSNLLFGGDDGDANLDDPSACQGLAEGSAEQRRCVADHIMPFYERSTRTLVLRPLWPLEERCTHAVVLTTRLQGEDGRPVQSPFREVNAPGQEAALRPAGEVLLRYGQSPLDIAFAWAFTTGSTTSSLLEVRAGLYGQGPLARLAAEMPPEGLVLQRPPLHDGSSAYLPGGCNAVAAAQLLDALPGDRPATDDGACARWADLAAVGGIVQGTFPVPDLLADKDGRARPGEPDDEDEIWEVNAFTGAARYRKAERAFVCTLPRRAADCAPGEPASRPFCPPYPTLVYGHGLAKNRFEALAIAGRAAAMGLAVCAADLPGHGGAARDLDNDGVSDPGGDVFSDHAFHTRDLLRQAALEQMQLVRILRSFDGRRSPAGLVLGDWDADGAPDLGGAAPIAFWGHDLGALVASVLAGGEPSLDVAMSSAGGGGLSDVLARSTQPATTAALASMAGPFLAASPTPGDAEGITLAFLVAGARGEERLDFARVRGLTPGDSVELENLVTGRTARAVVGTDGRFVVPFAADALPPSARRALLRRRGETWPAFVVDTDALGDRLRLRFFDRTGVAKAVHDAVADEAVTELQSFRLALAFQGVVYPGGAPLVAPAHGLGLGWGTPALRRHLGGVQDILAAADPAVWLAHYARGGALEAPALTRPQGGTKLLLQAVAGDTAVPVAAAVTQARAAGLLGDWRRDSRWGTSNGERELFAVEPRLGRPVSAYLAEAHVIEGLASLQRFATAALPRAVLDVDAQGGDRMLVRSPDGRWVAPPRPSSAPLRRRRPRIDGAFDALSFVYTSPHGGHGFFTPDPRAPFDAGTHAVNAALRFAATGGRALPDDEACDCSAAAVPEGLATALGGRSDLVCREPALKVCGDSCAAVLALRPPPAVSCP